MKNRLPSLLVLVTLALTCSSVAQQDPPKKRLLVVGMSAGFQHDSVSDALAAMYNLGKESGLWDAYIRTDTQWITKKKLSSNAKNLDFFDAVFFMTTGELPMDEEQKSALLSFVRDDGKGFLGAHNATDTFYQWPEYGEMIGGYFDGHPWNQFEATIKVEDRTFPATRHYPALITIFDEIYQTKQFSRSRVRVLMSLDTSNVDMTKEGVKYESIPITWVRNYGKGRVFYNGFGHPPAVWERPDIRQMWVEAVKWTMKMTEGDATPLP